MPDLTPSGEPWPRISIVTPSYNQGQFIEETIRSVLLQGYPDLEYIIIDGGSTDESVGIIRKYAPWLEYWVSEKDKGQADALNRGFFRSTGEILAYLNSDDLYEPGAFSRVGRDFEEEKNNPGVLVYPVEDFGRCISVVYVARQNHTVISLLSGETYLHQPGVFWCRKGWNTVKGFDSSYRYCFDRKLFMQLMVARLFFSYHTGPVLTRFRWHDQSKTFMEMSGGFVEEIDRLAKEFGKVLVGAGIIEREDWVAVLSKRRQIAMDATRARIFYKKISFFRVIKEIIWLLYSDPQVLKTRFFWGTVKDIFKNMFSKIWAIEI